MLTPEKTEKLIKTARLLLIGFALIRILKAEGGGGDDLPDDIRPF